MGKEFSVREVSAGYSVDEELVPVGFKESHLGIIPRDWEIQSLSNFIGELESGVSVNSIDALDVFSHGKHVLKTSCVSNSYFYDHEAKSIVPSDVGRAKVCPKAGRIIISRMNTPELVGEVGYVTADYLDLFLPDRLWQVKYKIGIEVDGRWLALILSYPLVARKIKEAATGTSSTMKNISQEGFLSIAIPCPKFHEQTAIANVLSDVDVLINSLEKLIAKKHAIKTAAMQELLTGRVRLTNEKLRMENGELKNSACSRSSTVNSQRRKGYRQSELGEIPEDWEIVTVGDKCDLLTGFPFSSSKYAQSGVKLLRGSNVKRGETDWSEEITQYWPELTADIRQYELREKDIVISMDGSLVGRSFAQLSKADLPAVLLQRVARVRSEEVEIDYVKEWVCSTYFTDHCDSVKTVTAIPHISPADIKNFKFVIPPTKGEQKIISSALSNMRKEVELLSERLKKMRQIKQGMMQELLTGRIRLVNG